MLPFIMDQGKGAHYRNQNVDFFVKRKVFLGTESTEKELEILLTESPKDAQ